MADLVAERESAGRAVATVDAVGAVVAVGAARLIVVGGERPSPSGRDFTH